jgi:hypothetical protein
MNGVTRFSGYNIQVKDQSDSPLIFGKPRLLTTSDTLPPRQDFPQLASDYLLRNMTGFQAKVYRRAFAVEELDFSFNAYFEPVLRSPLVSVSIQKLS